MRLMSLCWAALTLSASLPAGAWDATTATTDDGKSLGHVVVQSACAVDVREDLVRGLALLHHMTYEASEAAFREAAEADPECAFAYWGQAMSYVHPLWPDTVPEEKLEAGRALLERARSAGSRTPRDDAYVEAIAAYYAAGAHPEGDRLVGLLRGWRAATEADPSDPEARLFHALSLLATAGASDKTYANQRAGGEIAESVLAEYPEHPGAHHYVIHAYDFPPLAEKALPIARSYDDVAPENSHALHMTSHIFTRRGLWAESIEFNRRAAAAAAQRLPSGVLSMHHFHALDYLAYAHLQRGDDAAAQDVREHTLSLAPPFQDHAATAYALAAIPARLALERGDWAAAASVDPRAAAGVDWDAYPHIEAISQFSLGLGSARTGDRAAASRAIERLAELQRRASDGSSAYDWGLQVEIQKLAVEAWTAYAGGDQVAALETMRLAVEREASTEKNPVTPGAPLPAAELYGDMLLASGDPAAALEAYRAALGRSPNRLNSLSGAARAAEALGDDETAVAYFRQVVAVAAPGAVRDEIAQARERVTSRE